MTKNSQIRKSLRLSVTTGCGMSNANAASWKFLLPAELNTYKSFHFENVSFNNSYARDDNTDYRYIKINNIKYMFNFDSSYQLSKGDVELYFVYYSTAQWGSFSFDLCFDY